MGRIFLRTTRMKRYSLSYRKLFKPREGPYWILKENIERKKIRKRKKENNSGQ